MGSWRQRRCPLAVVMVAAAAVLGAASCGSGSDAACVATEVGEVCAEKSDRAIEFSGRGLAPDSDVSIDSTEFGPIVYSVSSDGQLATGASGLLSFVAGRPLMFAVYAVDADGQPLEGDIVVSS